MIGRPVTTLRPTWETSVTKKERPEQRQGVRIDPVKHPTQRHANKSNRTTNGLPKKQAENFEAGGMSPMNQRHWIIDLVSYRKRGVVGVDLASGGKYSCGPRFIPKAGGDG